ncbi:TPA: RNA 3'-phosphate cyclase [Candidatus Micrarchaeota archaeon]|nr:RNA 3'-phosphate cyclase [Candidatus Micrarchaeota archaeon]
MLEIDGSAGEGGGQVLRTALSVACVRKEKVRIYNIRAGRESGGLKAQHLGVCQLLANITDAKMQGAALGSKEIIFEPGEISGGEYNFDIGTAGSCTLFLQAALPVLLAAKKQSVLKVKGGTHVRAAPTYEYFAEVFLPAIKLFGAKCKAEMLRPGFFPKGGGEAELVVQPSKLTGVLFTHEEHKTAHYSIISSMLPEHVAEREEEKIAEALKGMKLSGRKKSLQAPCPGNAVSIWAGCFGASSLGEQGKKAEDVALEAAGNFLSEIKSGASVDFHLADQLLLYAALSEGRTSFSTSQFSEHLKTNAEVLRRMTGRNIILAEESRVEVF